MNEVYFKLSVNKDLKLSIQNIDKKVIDDMVDFKEIGERLMKEIDAMDDANGLLSSSQRSVLYETISMFFDDLKI